MLEDGVRELERRVALHEGLKALRADWMRYATALSPYTEICARCGQVLERDTAYIHCAACLATRGIDEAALRRACAKAFEHLWPFTYQRLDERRWVDTFIAFWLDRVDPMESRAIPYRTRTLASAFRFVQRHLAASDATTWTVPPESRELLDPAMEVRARGEVLVVGVGTLPRIADSDMRTPLASFDTFLELARQPQGWLVLEKLSRRARRGAPVEKRVVTTARGHRVHQLRCLQEERFWIPACVP